MVEFPDIFPTKESPEWATYCPSRKPEFKAHTKKGLAHSAIAAHKPHAEIALYRLEVAPTAYFTDGVQTTYTYTSTTANLSTGFKTQWRKVWEYVYPDKCDFCENPLARGYNNKPDARLPWRWKGRVMDAPVVCQACYTVGYQESVAEQERKRDLERLAALKELYPDA